MAECDGICVRASDLLEGSGNDVVYAHPGCPLHAPGEKCGCGQRMCLDCGGPWCAVCNQRVPTIAWGKDMVCDACHADLVRFGMAMSMEEAAGGV